MKFDRTINQAEWGVDPIRAVCPICLPDDDYDELGAMAYTMGYGLVSQHGKCFTNAEGPSIFTDCATGTMKEEGWTYQHWFYQNNQYQTRGCIHMNTPATTIPECDVFNREHEQETRDHEVVLVPKDRSKPPFTCFKSRPFNSYGAGGIDEYRGWCATCNKYAKENGKM